MSDFDDQTADNEEEADDDATDVEAEELVDRW